MERPWILFEAGVAKGKLNTPVIGVALGVPLSRVSAGPFYQFQNMEDSDEEITKLVHQLARRAPTLELDSNVVKNQVGIFKAAEAAILKTIPTQGSKPDKPKRDVDESSIAKLGEEMKVLPSRVAERLADIDPMRRRRKRRFHPMMLDQLMSMGEGDPIGILVAASMVRDDAPWLYELVMEVYRVAKSGDRRAFERELQRLQQFSELLMRSPFIEDLGFDKETTFLYHELPAILEHWLMRPLLREKKPAEAKKPG